MNVFTQRLNSTRLLQNGVFICLLVVLQTHSSFANSRTSANYSAITETVDIAGGISSSASYSTINSAGIISGVSISGSPVLLANNGYIGQLYDVTAVQVTALPMTLNETSTRQLGASATLDDGTTLASLAASVAWSVDSGPVTGISGSGMVTAGTVYQDTTAVVRGSYFGAVATANLMVLETIPDNYGSYAGDGLPDGWQVQTMGLSGTSGGPTLDPDGDGLSNLMEYALGLNPALQSTLPATTVLNSGNMEFTYTRSKTAITGGTQFQVQWSDTLEAASWSGSGVSEQILSDDGTQQQVKATLPAGSGGRRFVRLRVQ